MEDNIVKTFEDGSVQALIVQKSWNGRTSYRAKFRRAFVKKTTGEMSFAYDYDDHHLESLRKSPANRRPGSRSRKRTANSPAAECSVAQASILSSPLRRRLAASTRFVFGLNRSKTSRLRRAASPSRQSAGRDLHHECMSARLHRFGRTWLHLLPPQHRDSRDAIDQTTRTRFPSTTRARVGRCHRCAQARYVSTLRWGRPTLARKCTIERRSPASQIAFVIGLTARQ